MGVRFTSTFYSTHSGTEYRIDITDSSYSSTTKAVELNATGFELQYLQEGDEIYQPIKPSQVTIPLIITQDSNGAALLTWLQDTLLNGNEDKYNVLIYRSNELWWMGVILPDIAKHDDSGIAYDWQITAKDGLNRLKNFDFDVTMGDPMVAHSVRSIKDIIFQCLNKTPLYLSTTATLLFSTSVEWYEDNMPSRADTTDPLDQTYVDTWAFTDNEGSQRVRKSIYDTLEIICKAFGMRLIMSNGIFRFIQIGSYEQVTPTFERFYRRSDGAYVSVEVFADEVELNVTDTSLPRVTQGNIWQYFPPLKNARIKFPFTNLNMLNGAGAIPYSENLPNNIVGGAGVHLVFSTSISINITDVAFSQANGAVIVAQINLQLGSSYVLKKDVLGALNSWSATLTDNAEFYKDTKSRFVTFEISFVTSEIPSGIYDVNTFDIDITECKDAINGSTLTFAAVRNTGATRLVYSGDYTGNQAFYKYNVQNTNVVINSYDIEESDATLGEMFFAGYYGGLNTGDTSSWNPSTGQWKIKGSGTAYNFILLRLREIMAAQITAIPKYIGGIVGAADINPHTLITYDGDSYILNGARYNAQAEQWDGEYFYVDYDRVSVEDIDVAEEEPGGDTNQQLRKAIGEVSTQLDNATLKGGTKKTTVVNTNTTLQAITQNIIATDGIDVTLPAAADWTAFEDGNSIEINIVNAAGGDNVVVKNSGGSTLYTLTGSQYVRLISDGTQIYKIG